MIANFQAYANQQAMGGAMSGGKTYTTQQAFFAAAGRVNFGQTINVRSPPLFTAAHGTAHQGKPMASIVATTVTIGQFFHDRLRALGVDTLPLLDPERKRTRVECVAHAEFEVTQEDFFFGFDYKLWTAAESIANSIAERADGQPVAIHRLNPKQWPGVEARQFTVNDAQGCTSCLVGTFYNALQDTKEFMVEAHYSVC